MKSVVGTSFLWSAHRTSCRCGKSSALDLDDIQEFDRPDLNTFLVSGHLNRELDGLLLNLRVSILSNLGSTYHETSTPQILHQLMIQMPHMFYATIHDIFRLH